MPKDIPKDGCSEGDYVWGLKLLLTSGNSPAPAGRTSYEIPRSGSSSSTWLPLRPDKIQKGIRGIVNDKHTTSDSVESKISIADSLLCSVHLFYSTHTEKLSKKYPATGGLGDIKGKENGASIANVVYRQFSVPLVPQSLISIKQGKSCRSALKL